MCSIYSPFDWKNVNRQSEYGAGGFADYFPKSQQEIAYQRLLESLNFCSAHLGISTINLTQGNTSDEAEEGADNARSLPPLS